ncbi:MAG: hypothetical protein Q8Q65_03545, partial [bacterium]|nr:hypothetical protein [bacterium]
MPWNKLINLLAKDQENIRRFRNGEINKTELEKVNSDITHLFKLNIKENGFPFKNIASKDEYMAAIVISLHADLELLKTIHEIVCAAGPDQVEPSHKAFFIDKLRVARGQPQIYGTQYKNLPDGKIELLPVEDKKNLNIRRAE